jgi:hypothetical protein
LAEQASKDAAAAPETSLVATASNEIQDALDVIHQFNVDDGDEEVAEMKAALTTVIKNDSFWPKFNALTPVLSFEQEMEVNGDNTDLCVCVCVFVCPS